MHALIKSLALTLAFCGLGAFGAAHSETLPVRVQFPAADGRTMLVGYLFMPEGPHGARTPAVVMMHGRAGAYSSAAHDRFDATTLSKRHALWGHVWAQEGYAALLVDGFGPRGYAGGFPIHSYDDRPEAVSEVTVRPFDAYSALAYLRSRPDIDARHIALQGWSNGGSATIATMSADTLEKAGLSKAQGFAGAIAFYPACAMHDRFKTGYRPYAPIRIFSGDADEEVSAAVCARLVDNAAGGDIAIRVYPGATHGFDDPGAKRQRNPDNASAAVSAMRTARTFVAGLFGGRASERVPVRWNHLTDKNSPSVQQAGAFSDRKSLSTFLENAPGSR